MLLLYLPSENVPHSFSYFHFLFLFFKKNKMKKKQKWLLIHEAHPTGEHGTWAKPELDRQENKREKILELLNWSEAKWRSSAPGLHFTHFWNPVCPSQGLCSNKCAQTYPAKRFLFFFGVLNRIPLFYSVIKFEFVYSPAWLWLWQPINWGEAVLIIDWPDYTTAFSEMAVRYIKT